MTKQEKAVLTRYSHKINDAEAQAKATFDKLGNLYEQRSGGMRNSSVDAMFDYLMTSNDRSTREQAKHLYREYYASMRERRALLELYEVLTNNGIQWKGENDT